jgi:hypothetical protein
MGAAGEDGRENLKFLNHEGHKGHEGLTIICSHFVSLVSFVVKDFGFVVT